MASTLQLMDVDDATVLFDFNSPTGVNNPRQVKSYYGLGGSFQPSSDSLKFIEFEPVTAFGGKHLKARHGLKLATWRTRIKAASYDDLMIAVGRLGELFHDGGRALKWQAEGSTIPVWIDFEPSPTPALFDR